LETRGKNDGTLGEEISAFGQRTKGATKTMVGDAIDDEQMEVEGQRENARGRERQANNYVTGLYSSPEAANLAYDSLTTKHGYKADDISVMMSDKTRMTHFGDVKPGTELSGGTKAAEGLGKGAAIGGGIGAALAALFAIGTSIAIPGLGLIVAGPIAAALAGAGAGGATGGLIGALIGAGIPEDRAKEYERGINDGGILIGTRYRDAEHARELERDFTSYGGSNVRY
jgi:uncharacterized protein YjbJ (UPF0337 family)